MHDDRTVYDVMDFTGFLWNERAWKIAGTMGHCNDFETWYVFTETFTIECCCCVYGRVWPDPRGAVKKSELTI